MINDPSVLGEEFINRTRELLKQMEEGNEEASARLLDELTKLREDSLFRELGKLTREFHEALNNFRLDSRIQTLAENEIPDARDRLTYVITMTQQAADRTLSAVEASLPICERVEQRAQDIKAQWELFLQRRMDADQFRDLSREIDAFLAEISTSAPDLRGNLQTVLLAQDFQDLTGQIIRRVITLVEEMEVNLVELVRISGQKLMPSPEDKQQTTERDMAPAGPVVPGVDIVGRVSGQDEVDDLLSSLGF